MQPGEPAAQHSPGLESPGLASRPNAAAQAGHCAPLARLSRSLANRERLGRLRQELGKIAPVPCDPVQARNEILNAMARAGLGDWSVPALDDPTTQRCADGSYRLALLAHAIVLNPWGAFRIVDLYSQAFLPYFERTGRDGQPFQLPYDVRFERVRTGG